MVQGTRYAGTRYSPQRLSRRHLSEKDRGRHTRYLVPCTVYGLPTRAAPFRRTTLHRPPYRCTPQTPSCRLSTTAALIPPNPKLLLSAYSTSAVRPCRGI